MVGGRHAEIGHADNQSRSWAQGASSLGPCHPDASMIVRHRKPGRLFVVSGAQLNAIADQLDRDVPVAGEGLDFTQEADGRTFFIPGADGISGPTGAGRRPTLPRLPDPQVTPGRALNDLIAAAGRQRGFSSSGIGMRAGVRGRVFSAAPPYVTPPFPPPPPPPPSSSSSSSSGSSPSPSSSDVSGSSSDSDSGGSVPHDSSSGAGGGTGSGSSS